MESHLWNEINARGLALPLGPLGPGDLELEEKKSELRKGGHGIIL